MNKEIKYNYMIDIIIYINFIMKKSKKYNKKI